jgi:hypothetical protein
MKQYFKAFMVVGLSFALMGQTRFPTVGGGAAVGDANSWTGVQTFATEALFSAGTASEPGIAWSADDDGQGSGWYRRAANRWALSNGVNTAGVVEFGSGGSFYPTTSDVSFLTGALGTGIGASISVETTLTPDGIIYGVPSTSNLMHVTEQADRAFDFNNCSAGTSAQTNPTLCWHSADQATNEWGEVNTSTAGLTTLKSGQELMLQSGQIGAAGGKALSAGSATAVLEISVAQGVHTGGVVHWTIVADDSTNFQALSGSTQFQAVNPTGTEVCTVATTGGTDEASSSGTLTNTVTCTVGLTDVVQIAFNAASSLTETTLVAYHTTILNGPGTVTPQ